MRQAMAWRATPAQAPAQQTLMLPSSMAAQPAQQTQQATRCQLAPAAMQLAVMAA